MFLPLAIKYLAGVIFSIFSLLLSFIYWNVSGKISLNNNFQAQDLDTDNKRRRRRKKKIEEIQVSPSLNFVVATYYKGTGIEEVLKKMEKYLDEASKEESQINSI